MNALQDILLHVCPGFGVDYETGCLMLTSSRFSKHVDLQFIYHFKMYHASMTMTIECDDAFRLYLRGTGARQSIKLLGRNVYYQKLNEFKVSTYEEYNETLFVCRSLFVWIIND